MMDKQEYREFLEEIKKGYENGDYEMVVSYADEIELGKIREPRILELIADSYSRTGNYQQAIGTLSKARDRNSSSKNIAYKLSELSVKTGDLDSAVKYYEDFCNLAGKDSKRYILKYEIGKAGGIPVSELIKVLEKYNRIEKDEKWQYELARLYHEAGDEKNCVALCDDIFLWYADGEYVKKALELKFSHIALTPVQQQKYEEMMREYIEPSGRQYRAEEEEYDVPDPRYRQSGQPEEPAEPEIASEPENEAVREDYADEIYDEDPHIEDTRVIPVADILQEIEAEDRKENEPADAEEESAEPDDEEPEALQEPEPAASAAEQAEPEPEPEQEEPAEPVYTSKTSEITMDELRRMIHEGNRKKAAQGVFFTMEEVSAEDIADEIAQKEAREAARRAAEEEAARRAAEEAASREAAAAEEARLAEEAERLAAEEAVARHTEETEAFMAAGVERVWQTEKIEAADGRQTGQDLNEEKAAQVAAMEQAAFRLKEAARLAAEDEPEDDDILEEPEENDPYSLTEPAAEEPAQAEAADEPEVQQTYEPEAKEPEEQKAVPAADEPVRAEIINRSDTGRVTIPGNTRKLKLKKIVNDNENEPELEETQFISRTEIYDRLFREGGENEEEIREEISEELPEESSEDSASDNLGMTQVFRKPDVLKDTVLSTMSDAEDYSDRDMVQARLGAAIQEILHDADAVLGIDEDEQSRTIHIVLPSASAAKLGITSAMLSPLAADVVKPDLFIRNQEDTQAILDAISSEYGTPRIIDNVDFSYISMSRDEDGQMGINLDLLVRDDDNIEGQITFYDVFDTYNNRIRTKKEEVAAIEAERLRQIQEAVNLTAPVTLPYAMEDMELDDIVITDLEGNIEEKEPESFELDLSDIGIVSPGKEDAEDDPEMILITETDSDDGIEISEIEFEPAKPEKESEEEAAAVQEGPEEPAAVIKEESEEPAVETEAPEEPEQPEEELEIPPWKRAYIEEETADQAAEPAETEPVEQIEEEPAEDGSAETNEESEYTEEGGPELIIPEITEDIVGIDEETDEVLTEEETVSADGAETAADGQEEQEVIEEPADGPVPEITETLIAEEESEEIAVAPEEPAEQPEEEFEIPPWKLAYILQEEAEKQAEQAEAAEEPETVEEAEPGDAAEENEDAAEDSGESSAETENVIFELPPWKIAQIMENEEHERVADTETEEADAPEESITEDASDDENAGTADDEAAAAIAEFERSFVSREIVNEESDEEDLDALGDSLAAMIGNLNAVSQDDPEPEADRVIAEFERSITESGQSEEEIEGIDALGESLAELVSGETEEENASAAGPEDPVSEAVPEAETAADPETVPEAGSEMTGETGASEADRVIAEFERSITESGQPEEEIEGIDALGDSLAALVSGEAEDEIAPAAEPEEPVSEEAPGEEAVPEPEIQAGYTLSDDIREEISEFLLIDGMEESITGTIGDIIDTKQSGDPTGGNMVITGDVKSGKTFLSIAVIKAVAEALDTGNGRVAKVKAELLNGKNIDKVFNKVNGSDLIIENVGYLEDTTIRELTKAMKEGRYQGMLVLEGNQLAVENIFSNFPEFAELFRNRIDINELSIVQWADIAIRYADEKGYELDDMARLALHAKINEINVPTARLGYDNIIEIMEEAMKRADKRNTGKLFAAFSRKGGTEKKEIIEADLL